MLLLSHSAVYAQLGPFMHENLDGAALDKAAQSYRARSKDKSPTGQIHILKEMAAVYLEHGRNDSAVQCYEEAMAIAKRSNALLLTRWGLMCDRAHAYLQAGKFDRVVADCNEALKMSVTDKERMFVLRIRADAYLGVHDFKPAVADLSTVLNYLKTMVGSTGKLSLKEMEDIKAIKVRVLYKRAIAYAKLNMTNESNRDRQEADRLTEDL